MKLSEIKINKNNPRTIQRDKMEKLKRSIEQFPKMMSLRPIVIDNNKMILGGNMRYLALKELGHTEIPDEWVKFATQLTDEEKNRFIIEDNVGFGDWDWDILANEWDAEELEEWGLDIPEMEAEELGAEEDDYEIPDAIETDIVLGDLFQIGEHRLLCGDSTDAEQVARLMNGEKADMILTDPPYNTGMKGKPENPTAWLSGMFNDALTNDEWERLITKSIKNINQNTKNDCAIYVFIDWRKQSEIRKAVEQIADVKNIIVWDKVVHGMGSDYKSTYELCVVGKKGKPEINNRIEYEYQDIWRVQRKIGRNKEHATQKPIELLVKPINHASKLGELVFDIFLGSGSTMVASHQLNRKCYGIEIDPKYCQVTIDRMKKLDPDIKIEKIK